MIPTTSTVAIRQCLSDIRERVGAVGLRWASATARRTRVFDIEIVDLTDGADGSAFNAIGEALRAIQRWRPRVILTLVRSAPRIAVVRGLPWAGQYWRFYRGIALEVNAIEQQVPAALAMTIIHEATHARIASFGIPYLRYRERIEERCIREEIEFASGVENGVLLIQGATLKLVGERNRKV